MAVSNTWTSTIYFENDLFSGADNYYTNGVKLSLISRAWHPCPESALPTSLSIV